MALAPGAKFGSYEILGLLGSGGMGEVYRARDTALGREVAVKVLHAATLHDPDRLRRFRQEAQSTASLNHPNILAIYLVGEHGGAPFIVSELLEGDSLRERIRKEPLPLRKCLDIAAQIIEGLAAAHDKGIVHRDLKPENIFLTKDGRVKILDFGLAKLLAPGNQTGASDLLTISQGSVPGLVLGTAGYMSPEQVRGQPLDTRSDIFSFGVIFYEMLSGKNVFQRGTAVETMNALLKEEVPELTQISPAVSPGLDRIARRCLEKELADRFQSARDLGFALQAVSGSGVSSSAATAAPPSARHRRFAMTGLAAAAVLAAAGAYFAGRYRTGLATPTQPEFQQLTFRRGTIWNARFGPDERTILYGASMDGTPTRVYATRTDSPEAQPLGTENLSLFGVSPSGELAVSLGCLNLGDARCAGTLARMPLAGGAPRSVISDVVAADWLPDRKDIAVVRHSRGHFLVEFPIGKTIYTTPGWITALRISPDGKYVAIADNPAPGNDAGYIAILDAEGKRIVSVGPWVSSEGLAWSPNGAEVWFAASAGNEGWADQIRAVELSGRERIILRLPGITRLHDIARDGRVLLSKEQWRAMMPFRGPGDTSERDLSWLDLSGLCDMSADGRSVIFSESGQANVQYYFVYQRKTDGSPAVKLGEGVVAAISPDGKWVLSMTAETPAHLVLLPTGVGEAKTLPTEGLTQLGGPSWTADAKRIVYAASDGRTWRTYLQDLDGGKPRAITPEIAVPFYLEGQLVSPDNRYVFERDLESRGVLYPLDGSQAIEVHGLQPMETFAGWAADGRSIYLFRPDVYPVKITKLDVTSGTTKTLLEIMPEDRVGLDSIFSVRVSRDEKSIAYSYQRSLSELYLVTGLK